MPILLMSGTPFLSLVPGRMIGRTGRFFDVIFFSACTIKEIVDLKPGIIWENYNGDGRRQQLEDVTCHLPREMAAAKIEIAGIQKFQSRNFFATSGLRGEKPL